MNRIKRWTLTIYLLGLPCFAISEEPTVIFEDGYVVKIYSDGSGTIGKKFDPKSTLSCNSFSCEYKRKNANSETTFDDEWSFQVKNDEMDDEQIITVRRYPHKISDRFGEMELKSDIYLWINLSQSTREVFCVAGHDYPGLTAMIRVDSEKAIETNENGCLSLSNSLDDQLRSGSKVFIRGSHWPYKSPETKNISLDGYRVMTDFLRDRRK
ncbi:MAG: hypothetical protein ABJQ98_16530 [Alloalcanivorax venustensis]|uniref:hypothetical protein n=1 Tax=Alloalcanivorax venustensis TaxID=172371 RepID=UPI003299F301